MSLRFEQHHSLLKTREFLRDILVGKPLKVSELRRRAGSCLHHYPFLNEHGKPMWSNDPFTTEEGESV